MAEGAAEQDDTRERKLLFATYALLFFGVPSRGMEIRSLMIMVQGQPNAPFISMLDRNSEPLARQHRRFCEAFPFTDSKVFSFYETQQSPTAVEVRLHVEGWSYLTNILQISGRWEMSGPMEVLVDITSATQSRGAWESKEYFFQPISKSHSELVKYSREDEYYKLVKGRLEDVAEKAAEIIHQRFQAQSRSGTYKVGGQRVSPVGLSQRWEILHRPINDFYQTESRN
jgi:protein SERAC1